MKKTLRFFIIFTTIIITAFTLHPAQAQVSSVDDEASSLIAALNGWRLELGISPLQPDPILTQMAVDQARYILSLPQVPAGGAIHNDRSGNPPSYRATRPPYNWATYATNGAVAVNEIAFFGRDIRRALDYWRGSSVHNRTVSNDWYRQIGVAAIPHPFGFAYFVVFGSQPNVLPTIADVAGGRLYLTNERFISANALWIQQATQVQLFDGLGRPLQPDWLPWQPSLALPQGVGNTLFVLYSNGTRVAMSEVDLSGSMSAYLPTNIIATGGSPPTPVTPQATAAVRLAPATAAPATRIPPTATPITQDQTAAQAATQAPATANLLLIYSARTLTIQNISTSPLNVRELQLRGGGKSISALLWDTQWLSGSLEALGVNDCLQVWSWTEAASLPQESACRNRRGVTTISEDRLFWRSNDIEVYWRTNLIATCSRTGPTCSISIPSGSMTSD